MFKRPFDRLTPANPAGSTPSRFSVVYVALAGFLALGTCNVAVAVPGWSASCNSVTQHLKSVDIAAQQWAIERVDLITADTDAVDDLDEPTSNVADSAAPLLFLTPRVANILEYIFDNAGDVPVEDTEAAPMTVAAGEDSATQRQETAENAGDATDLSDLDYAIQHGAMRESMYNIESLPRFQRPMYRTDI